MTFKVGDRVVCVDATALLIPGSITVGEEYEVTRFDGFGGVTLSGIVGAYWANRFVLKEEPPNPLTFWMVHVTGSTGSTVRHATHELALAEAKRLAALPSIHGRDVFVLKTTDLITIPPTAVTHTVL